MEKFKQKSNPHLLALLKISLLTWLISLFVPITAFGQNIDIDFKQGSNKNPTLGEIVWIGSILQNSNSRYAEGMSTLQRIQISKITPSASEQTIVFKMQSDKAGFHAYDFITSWQQALSAAALIAPGQNLMPATTASPLMHTCGDLATGGQPPTQTDLCVLVHEGANKMQVFMPLSGQAGSETTLPLAGDTRTVPQATAAYEQLFGQRYVNFYSDAAITNASIRFLNYSSEYVFYEFKFTSPAATTVMLEFAAHIAVGVDIFTPTVGYGLGRGASNISGGPYHVSGVSSTLGNIGSLDNQLQGSEVLLAPSCSITPGSQTICSGASSSLSTTVVITNPSDPPPTITWSFETVSGSPTPTEISGQGTTTYTFNPGTAAGVFKVKVHIVNDGGLFTDCEQLITVSAQPTATAGPDQRLCAATSVTLAGNNPSVGTGTWTKQSGPAATITTPSQYNTTVTGLTPGTYVFRWTVVNGACSAFDEVQVIIDAAVTANAGVDQRQCGGTSVNLTGNNPAPGTGLWTKESGGAATITSPTSASTSVTGMAAGTYVFRWTVTNGTCSATDLVQVIIDATVTANAGVDQRQCGGTSVNLTGNNPAPGTGLWTKESGGAATITSPTSASTSVTGMAAGTYVFRWTVTNGTCSATDLVQVIIDATVTANAGVDQRQCGGTSVNLTGNNPAPGTGLWTKESGGAATITSPTSASTSVTGMVPGTYVFRWTVTNGTCSATDLVQVILDEGVAANAGVDQRQCGGTSVNLTGSNPAPGTGLWTKESGGAATITSPTSASTSVTGMAAGTYVFRWTVTNGTCSSTDLVQVIIDAVVTANAGVDQRQCGGTSVNLTGNNPAPGTGLWTKESGGAATITSPTSASTSVTGMAAGTYVFRWTVTNGTCSATDLVQVIIDAAVTANAGVDQRQCGGTSVNLTGNNPAPGTGLWTKESGGAATITSPTSASTSVTGMAAGTYVFRWTVTNGTCSATDLVQVIIDATVTANAGVDQRQCGGTSVNLTGNNPAPGTGLWTKESGGAATITSPTSASTSVTGMAAGTYVFRWTVTNGTCSATDLVQVIIDATVTANAGVDQRQCGGTSVTLTGNNPAPGTGLWTKVSGGTATITSPTSASTTVTGMTFGTYVFRWTVTNGTCSATDLVEVVIANCGEQICTYTQGAYGSTGGSMCNGLPEDPGPNQFNTFDMITNSIHSYTVNSYTPPLSGVAPFVDHVLVVGKPGASVYMNSTASNVDAIIEYLPGGGPSKELLAGNYNITALPGSYLKNGNLNNTLLAQTITLGLNLGIGTNLGSFELQAGVLVTADAEECGSNVPLERECIYNPLAPYNLIDVINDYHYHTISAAVVNAIPGSPNTVSGLFELANRALANVDGVVGSENGASLSAIAQAVDMINNAFDECKLFVGWDVEPCPETDPEAPIIVSRMGREATPAEAKALEVSAYPNPFTDKVRFVVDAPVAGQGSLEVYNTLGQKVGVVYRGIIQAGKGQVFEYNVPAASRTNLFYILRMNGQQITGKLLNIKN